MRLFSKGLVAGAVFAAAAAGMTVPAQARSYTYFEVGVGDYGYRPHDGYDGYDRYGRWDRYDRDRWERERRLEWRRHQAREDSYRYGYGWRDRDDCWTEWRWHGPYGRQPVRVCR
jgi:hypothetical protein